MYEIKDLETAWKRYKRKQLQPWVLIASMALLAGIGGYYAYTKAPRFLNASLAKNDINLSHKKSEENLTVSGDKTPVSAPAVTTIEERSRGPVIPPSSESSPIDIAKATQVSEARSGNRDNPASESISAQDEVKPKRKKLTIEVSDSNDPKVLQSIERRFKLGHDTDDSLFLARTYYKKGNYKKAEYWAYQTNRINDGIEESWLIFAKSKYRSGKKVEAIRILDAYVKKNDSLRARILLEKMRHNTF